MKAEKAYDIATNKKGIDKSLKDIFSYIKNQAQRELFYIFLYKPNLNEKQKERLKELGYRLDTISRDGLYIYWDKIK